MFAELLIGISRRFAASALVLGVGIAAMTAEVRAADPFPFERELLLDVKPMKGSKRIPVLAIGRQGETMIDLWCNTVEGQVVVVDGIISIMTGAKTNRPCDAARLRSEDDILAALLDAKTWRRDGDSITFMGARTLRFRIPTN
jgi:heat shock protein HslJ